MNVDSTKRLDELDSLRGLASLSVVNIDNGFGAGYVASLINRLP